MIGINITRPAHFRGQAAAIGARLAVTSLEAAALIDAGRGELVKSADLQLVRNAVAADSVRTCAVASGPIGPRGRILFGPSSAG